MHAIGARSGGFTQRVARPTDGLDAVVAFHVDGLGPELLGRFDDHEGFPGARVGAAGTPLAARPRPTTCSLCSPPDRGPWQSACNRIEGARHRPVASWNPDWDRRGRTLEDQDGYRVVVLQSGSWPP